MGTEAGTCRALITPKRQTAGWETEPHSIAGQRTFSLSASNGEGWGEVSKSPSATLNSQLSTFSQSEMDTLKRVPAETAASLKELPHLRAYLAVVGDDASLSHDEKIERVRAILFGWDRAKSGVNGQDDSNNGN
jgi:arginine deiminase